MNLQIDYLCELCDKQTRSPKFARPIFQPVVIRVRCKNCESVSTLSITRPADVKARKDPKNVDVTLKAVARSEKWDSMIKEKNNNSFRVGW